MKPSAPPPKRGLSSSYVSKNSLMPNREGSSPSTFYDTKDKIGEGSFGQVFMVVRKKSGKTYVMKTMKKEQIEDQVAFANELHIQRDLDHPHICRIFDTFEEEEDFHIVIEMCAGGSLEDRLADEVGLEEPECHYITNQFLKALCYMHSKGIVHRDLKPENMLLKEKGLPLLKNYVKMVDFGFARAFCRGEQDLTTKCGTLHFMAPEIITQEYFDEKCDVWSAGVIVYNLLCGLPPFDGDTDNDILKSASEGKLDFTGEKWDKVSSKAKLAVMQMCKVDPKVRFTAEAALKCPWMLETFSLEQESLLSSQAIVKGMHGFSKMSKIQKTCSYLVAKNVTEFESKQFAMIRAKFDVLDKNGDGMLSLAELQTAVEECGLDETVAKDMFSNMDLNDEGLIEWSEFLCVMVNQKVLDNEEAFMKDPQALWAAFKVLDQDNDFKVSAEEILKTVNTIGNMDATLAEAQEFVNEGDANSNGFMDFDEFCEMMKRHADRKRTDSDWMCLKKSMPVGGRKSLRMAPRKSVRIAAAKKTDDSGAKGPAAAPALSPTDEKALKKKAVRRSMIRPDL